MNTAAQPTMQINPFKRPPIVQERVSLAELLNMMRSRINTGYMPGSTGERRYNSKPTYVLREVFVTSKTGEQLRFPLVTYPVDQSGYYAFEDRVAFRPCSTIFAHIVVSDVQIMVNLDTETAIVRLVGNNFLRQGFMEWVNLPDVPASNQQCVSLDRMQLEEILDTYL